MATKKNKIEVLLNATNNAKQGIDSFIDVLGDVGDMLDGFQSAVQIIGDVTRAIGDMAQEGAKVQNLEFAFRSITAEAGLMATDVLAEFDRLSGGMLSHADAMENFNLAAQLVGTNFAKDLPSAMGTLTKVSAATGESVDFLLQSLIRGVGRLSPMILDNLGIQVDLVTAYDDWAKANNRTVDSMSKAEQQTAVMAQVMALLTENTKALPEIADTAAGRMARWQATVTNLKNEAGKLAAFWLGMFADVLSPLANYFIPTIINKFGEWSDGLEGIMGIFRRWSDGMTETGLKPLAALQNALDEGDENIPFVKLLLRIVGIMQDIGDVFRGEKTPVQAFSDILKRLFGNAGPVIEKLVGISSAVNDMLKQFFSAKDVFTALALGIGGLFVASVYSALVPFMPLITLIGLLIGAIALLRNVWQKDFGGIRTAIVDAWNNDIKPALIGLKDAVFGAASDFPTLADVIQQVIVPALVNIAKFIAQVVIPAIAALATWFIGWYTTIIPPIIDVAQAIISMLLPAIGGAGDFIGDKLIPAISEGVKWIKDELIPVVLRLVSAFVTEAVPIIIMVAEWIRDVLVPAISDLAQKFIAWLIPAIQQAVVWFKTNMLPVIQQVATWVMTVLIPAIVDLYQQFVAWLIPAIQQVAGWIQTVLIPVIQQIAAFIIDKVVPAIVKFATGFWEILKAVINVVSFMVGTLFGVFKVVWTIVMTVVRVILILSGALWKLIRPLVEVALIIANLLSKVLRVVFQLFLRMGVWIRDLFFIILTDLARMINNDIAPAFRIMRDVIKILWDRVKDFVDKGLSSLKEGLDGLLSPFDKISEKIRGLGDKLSGIKLPDWMTGNSPSMWENWLWGVNDAMDGIAKGGIPSMNRAIGNMTGPELALANAVPASSAASVSALPVGQQGMNGGAGDTWNINVVAENAPDMFDQIEREAQRRGKTFSEVR